MTAQRSPAAMLGAPPTNAVGPAPSGLLWYGLSGAPPGVTWFRPMPAGSDGAYAYSRVWGRGSDGRMYLMVAARPLRRGLSASVYYYAAGPSKRVGGARPGASGLAGLLGEPPAATLGQPYDGAPDRPYPPCGPGWFEVPFDDEAARVEATSMLGQLPPSHFADRLTRKGLYRFFAFETAHGATSLGALRYLGENASTMLGQEPNIAPGGAPATPNPNSAPVFQAAQALLTYLSQNGCSQGFIQQVADFQNAYNATGLGPQISPDGNYGGNSQAALQIVLNSVNPPAGTAPDNCYGMPVPSMPGANPTPATPGGSPAATLPLPGDVYASLTSAQQSALRSALFSKINQNACPTVDVSSVTSPASLTDLPTLGIAVDCYQTIHGVGNSGAGVLDMATYNAIMGSAPSGGGVSAAGVVAGVAGVATVVAAVAMAATGYNPMKLFRG